MRSIAIPTLCFIVDQIALAVLGVVMETVQKLRTSSDSMYVGTQSWLPYNALSPDSPEDILPLLHVQHHPLFSQVDGLK